MTDPPAAESPSHTPIDGADGPTENVTAHAILGGRGRLLQARRGYRAGMDAALLAAAVGARPGERVLEAGCGAGGALVQAALRAPGATFVGVERNPDAARLCARNLVLNALDARVTSRDGEVGAGFRALGEPRFDAAFANPPFFDDPSALRAPAPERRGAWIADDGLAAWVAFLLDALRDGGAVTLVHRADRLGDLLTALGSRGGSVRVRAVHPFSDAPAKRVLVRAVRGGRAPLTLLPPLTLHARGDSAVHTPEADAILRGEAELGWT